MQKKTESATMEDVEAARYDLLLPRSTFVRKAHHQQPNPPPARRWKIYEIDRHTFNVGQSLTFRDTENTFKANASREDHTQRKYFTRNQIEMLVSDASQTGFVSTLFCIRLCNCLVCKRKPVLSFEGMRSYEVDLIWDFGYPEGRYPVKLVFKPGIMVAPNMKWEDYKSNYNLYWTDLGVLFGRIDFIFNASLEVLPWVKFWMRNQDSAIRFCRVAKSSYDKDADLLRKMLNEKIEVDFLLVSDEGEEFPCHKSVLAARMDYFQKLFANKDSEECQTGRITFGNENAVTMSGKSVNSFLQFIYRQNIFGTVDNFNIILELLKAANHFKQAELMRILYVLTSYRLRAWDAKWFSVESLWTAYEMISTWESSLTGVTEFKGVLVDIFVRLMREVDPSGQRENYLLHSITDGNELLKCFLVDVMNRGKSK